MINNNIDRSEIKLGYFGPGLSGRRTNIQYLYDQVSNAHQLGIQKEYVPNYSHRNQRSIGRYQQKYIEIITFGITQSRNSSL